MGLSLWALPRWVLLAHAVFDEMLMVRCFSAAAALRHLSITLASSLNLSLMSLNPGKILWGLHPSTGFRESELGGGTLWQSQHRFFHLSRLKAFLFASSDRHEYA